MYQRELYALKKMIECPTNQVESFFFERQAHEFFDEKAKEIQHKTKVSDLKTAKNKLKIVSNRTLSQKIRTYEETEFELDLLK